MKFVADISQNRRAAAWLLMMTAVAIHVFDETLTNFLPFYNEQVIRLKDRLPLVPMPQFTFEIWLGGLIGVIIVGFFLTFLVRRGGRMIRIVTIIMGIIMVGNALGHMLGSVYAGRLIPGFWSSPVLLVTAVFVVITGFKRSSWITGN
jgi:zinc transporter ZupT